MKVKIKSFNGELPSYLTVGKAYEVWTSSDLWSQGIRNDVHDSLVIMNFSNCDYLNGGSWEIVD